MERAVRSERYVNEGLLRRQTRRAVRCCDADCHSVLRVSFVLEQCHLARQLSRIPCSMNTVAPLHERVRAVTERIRSRSAGLRMEYVERAAAARSAQATRTTLSCTNLAHGFAAMDTDDKQQLRAARWPNLAIVSSYNDMLSAHRPLERFPELIKLAAREAGAVAQFAGGVPAMCDGVTQGQPGMELSLFS